MSIVDLLVILIVVSLLFWIVSLLPLPPKPSFLRNILYIVVAAICIVWLLNPGAVAALGVHFHK